MRTYASFVGRSRDYVGSSTGALSAGLLADSMNIRPLCTISAQLFAEHQVATGSHPSYRHEEPASPNTCVTLLTGGLLVRIQPEEPFSFGNSMTFAGR
jgi:hypothetical protein